MAVVTSSDGLPDQTLIARPSTPTSKRKHSDKNTSIIYGFSFTFIAPYVLRHFCSLKKVYHWLFATLFPHISSTFFPHPLVIMVRPRPPRSGGRSWTATRRKVAKSWAILAFNWCGLYKAKIIWLIYVHTGPRFVYHKMPYCTYEIMRILISSHSYCQLSKSE